jgi:murein DD-endopeptidase MepM/ murein hydrolase activator NlpD
VSSFAKRLWSLGLVTLATTALVGLARAGSHDLSGARERASEARAEEQALAGDIAAQSREIDAVEEDIDGLRAEVGALQAQLAQAQARLRELERLLAEKTRTLVRARQQLGIAQARLSGRLVDIYTAEEPDLVSVALGADSLEDLIDVLETRESVLENDDALVGQIEGLRVRVTAERARARVLRQRQAVETAAVKRRSDERRSALGDLVARRDALAQLRSARQRSLASVQVARRDWEAQAAALAAASTRVSAVAASAPPAADVHTATPPSTPSAGLGWPVQGTIVSPYGQRWGRLHSGIDIAAPAGTPIAAAASGRVVYAGSMSGYGLIVVIQHAGGIATAYAHNSSNAVSVGQSVAQGQTIASVGCTGHCYGDHVHFEVRVGGSPVDPMGYL